MANPNHLKCLQRRLLAITWLSRPGVRLGKRSTGASVRLRARSTAWRRSTIRLPPNVAVQPSAWRYAPPPMKAHCQLWDSRLLLQSRALGKKAPRSRPTSSTASSRRPFAASSVESSKPGCPMSRFRDMGSYLPQQCGSSPKHRRLPVKIPGPALALVVIAQVVLLARSLADLGHIGVLVHESCK